jgi:hypothetical protein
MGDGRGSAIEGLSSRSIGAGRVPSWKTRPGRRPHCSTRELIWSVEGADSGAGSCEQFGPEQGVWCSAGISGPV